MSDHTSVSAAHRNSICCASVASRRFSSPSSSARLTRFVKSFEIALMLVDAAGFVTHAAPLLYLCTFMMGMHSTLFGPVKYS